MRCFAFHWDDQAYDTIRGQLDKAWGHPNPETKTETCLPPACDATKDIDGAILISVENSMCEWSPAAEMLPQLVNAGAITEITEAEYTNAIRMAFVASAAS